MLDQAVGLTFVKQNTNLQDAMILLIGHIFGKQRGKHLPKLGVFNLYTIMKDGLYLCTTQKFASTYMPSAELYLPSIPFRRPSIQFSPLAALTCGPG